VACRDPDPAFAGHWLIDDADDWAILMEQSDQCSEGGTAGDERSGAVDRSRTQRIGVSGRSRPNSSPRMPWPEISRSAERVSPARRNGRRCDRGLSAFWSATTSARKKRPDTSPAASAAAHAAAIRASASGITSPRERGRCRSRRRRGRGNGPGWPTSCADRRSRPRATCHC